MNVDEIIDHGLSQADNVSPTDAAYVERRRRAYSFLCEVFDETYWARDWPRKKTSERLTVAAGTGQVAVPADYSSKGQFGGIYLVQGGLAKPPFMDEKPESVITDLRATGGPTDSPDVYAIFGMEELGSSGVFRDLIQLPLNTGVVTLEIHYQRKPPKLIDVGDPDAALSYTVTIARVGTTATATTSGNHGLETDDFVVVSGADQADYNGTFRIVVTGLTTFTYEVDSATVTPATGTITAALDVERGNSALNYISESFHRSVLLNGLKAKLLWSKGDARWRDKEASYQNAIKVMKGEKVRMEAENRRLPSFFGR